MKTTLYLASASPRRHELLKQIGIKHTVLHVPSPPGEDEPKLEEETPLAYVQRTALDKALRAQEWIEKELYIKNQSAKNVSDYPLAILSADTTVALGPQVLGKPNSKEDAAKILASLSNQTHTVYTALVMSVALPAQALPPTKAMSWLQTFALSTTRVTFAALTELDITEYIATGEPFGKAGAYGIQGHAARFISKIEGSYSGVMGLPLFETSQLIRLTR